MIAVDIIPILKDNYTYILKATNGKVAIVDPGEATPIIEHLNTHKLQPNLIFNTHHHSDHCAGNTALKTQYGSALAASGSEDRIEGKDIELSEGTSFTFGDEPVIVLDTPGHTRTHICLYFPQSRIVFTGDALFSLGCGRLFEGNAIDLFSGFIKLRALPGDTLMYCGHEYTEENARFALTVEPENKDLQARINEIKILRTHNRPTLPIAMATEKKTNPFLRAPSPEKLAELRIQKDRFNS